MSVSFLGKRKADQMPTMAAPSAPKQSRGQNAKDWLQAYAGKESGVLSLGQYPRKKEEDEKAVSQEQLEHVEEVAQNVLLVLPGLQDIPSHIQNAKFNAELRSYIVGTCEKLAEQLKTSQALYDTYRTRIKEGWTAIKEQVGVCSEFVATENALSSDQLEKVQALVLRLNIEANELDAMLLSPENGLRAHYIRMNQLKKSLEAAKVIRERDARIHAVPRSGYLPCYDFYKKSHFFIPQRNEEIDRTHMQEMNFFYRCMEGSAIAYEIYL